MFTGIIREVGSLKNKIRGGDAGGGGGAGVDGAGGMGAGGGGGAGDTSAGGMVTLVISCKKLRPKPGDSVCVNGVCLTVTKKTATGFEVDVVAETLKRTNLGELSTGTADRSSALNLEPALQARDTVDGHFVTGHVDAVARVTKVSVAKNGTELTIKMPKNLMRFIAYKGSVTINGVSLTVGAIKNTEVTVALIPFTQKNTNLGLLKKGDMVNIEIDLIARYLYNFDKIRDKVRINPSI